MRGPRLAALVLAATGVVAGRATTLRAQSPEDRRLLTALDAAVGGAHRPTVMEVREGDVRDLQRGLVELDDFLRHQDRRAMERALFRFDQVSTRHPDWAWPEYAMAHAFLLLHDTKAPLLDSQGTTLGEAHLDAMWRHLTEALRREPGFGRARRLVADLAYAAGDRELHDAMRDALAAEASRRDPIPEALIAWGRHQRLDQQYAIALAIFDRAGQLGADPAVLALERARTLEALGRPDEARRAYWAGAEHLTPRGRQLYRQDLGWILDDDSLAVFDAVPDSGAAGWLRRFWGERDAAAVNAPGHREVEHLRRWVYAFQHFRVQNPWDRIARSRVDFAFDDIRDQCVGSATGFYQQLPVVPPALPGDLRAAEPLLDHRGVIYLRHGEPFARAVPPEVLAEESGAGAGGGDAPVAAGHEQDRLDASLRNTEIWVYWLEGTWRVFQFRGSEALGQDAATTMSSYLPWQSAQAWQALARLLPGYQAAANWIANYRGIQQRTCLPEVHVAVAQQRADAVVGINTDTERPPILEPWRAVNRFFAVGASRTGAGAVLMTFAIPTQDLASRHLTDGRLAWPLRFHLVAYRTSDGTRVDHDTMRVFAARAEPTGGFITGWSEVQLAPGDWQVSVLMREDGDTAAGGHAIRRGLQIGASDDLLIGDIVTGRGDQPAWTAPDGPFPVNAMGFWPTGSTVELWYQVGGLAAGTDYRTTLEVMPASDSAHGSLRVASTDRATGTVTTVRKALALQELAPGMYFLRVTITADDHSTTREQVIVVTKREG